MKKIREFTFMTIKISAAALIIVFCIMNSGSVKTAVHEALTRCLTVIIPSLYGMMIISGFLVKSGLTGRISGILSKLGVIGSILPVLILSMFAGYPVGAKMLCAEVDKGHITRSQAEVFSGICFGAGPAFIFGCISSQLYGNTSAGKLILISTISSNIILAAVFSLKLRKSREIQTNSEKLHFSSDTLTESILSGGRSMADICIMITAFSVLTAFLSDMGILRLLSETTAELTGFSAEYTEGLLHAFLDVTAVDRLPHNNYRLLPFICALTSFGGVCVIMQISAVTSGKISMKPFIAMRSAAAVLSAVICRLIMPYMIADETVSAVKINVAVHREISPVPSVLLIIMTIILLKEYEKVICQKNRK